MRTELDTSQSSLINPATYSVIVSRFRVEEGARHIEPPEGMPVSLPINVGIPLGPNLTTHQPIEFGVTYDVPFAPYQAAACYSLTTPYCGLAVVQHQVGDFLPQSIPRHAIGLSVDGTLFPVSLVSDIIFADSSFKAIYICPLPHEELTTLILCPARYAGSEDAIKMEGPALHYITVDVPRLGTDWKRWRLGSSPN